MKKFFFAACLCLLLVCSPVLSAEIASRAFPLYTSELNIVYANVANRELKLNAFLPAGVTNPVPAIVEIHGGWWSGGSAATTVEHVGGWQFFKQHGLAVFSIEYRLGETGGFPQNIRDCRNAIRFLRQNAKRFNIDPDRIDVTGGSAGGHLSLMVAMVPENYEDGGPTPELAGVSARVAGSFSYIPPTDFVRFWNEGPEDVITNQDGTTTFRRVDGKIPNDARPHLRLLFHGVTPDTAEHQNIYTNICPIGWVRKDVPPLLICDGEKDPIVPGLEGKELYEKLHAVGADATYWMTPNGGHAFPGGPGFDTVLDDFITRTLSPKSSGPSAQ
ncbi:MAG TPA: alpha/beta hydrolase [Verrucomicrobiae bacterium]|nr:alpha/beta hydrolase [Verrucomicrobiae bacterium]